MLTLGTTNTLQGKANTAAVITYTLLGDLLTTTDGFGVIAQGQLPAAVGVLYTVPASTAALVKEIVLANTSNVAVGGIQFFINGSAVGNQILGSMTIPANGSAVYANGIWQVYDASGALAASNPTLNTSYTFAAPLTNYPDMLTHTGYVTTANGWLVNGFLSGYRNGNIGTQRLQGEANGNTYARYWNGTVWTAFTQYMDALDLTAKGSLLPSTGANAYGELLVGANGSVPIADSAAAMGMRWGNPSGYVNVVDNPYAKLKVDGVTDDLAALNTLLANAPDNSCLVWPSGTMVISGTATIPAGKHYFLKGQGRQKSIWLTTSGTADMLVVGDWYNDIDGFSFRSLQLSVTGNQTMTGMTTLNVAAVPALMPVSGTFKVPTVAATFAAATHAWATITYTGKTATSLTGVTVTVAGAALSGQGFGGAAVAANGYLRSAGYSINAGTQTNNFVRNVDFLGCFNGILQGGTLCSFQDAQFTDTIGTSIIQNGANINGIVHNITADCTMPAVSHLNIQQCGSLVVSDCDFIRATNNLLINPASTGAGVFAVYIANSFFDSGKGSNVLFSGNGNTQRVKFVNCWMCSAVNGGHGIEFASTAVGTTYLQPTGIDILQCDIYGNAGSGIIGQAANGVQDVAITQCRIAGNVTGININAATGGSNKTTFRIQNNRVGPTGGFGANTTGIAIATGAYDEILIIGNNLLANTTPLTVGTVTLPAANYSGYKILDNAGYNPLTGAAVATPAVPASGVVVTNTTGRRVTVFIKAAATTGALTQITVNGVATGSAPAASTVTPVVLEPGGTLAVAYTTAPTWAWVGQ